MREITRERRDATDYIALLESWAHDSKLDRQAWVLGRQIPHRRNHDVSPSNRYPRREESSVRSPLSFRFDCAPLARLLCRGSSAARTSKSYAFLKVHHQHSPSSRKHWFMTVVPNPPINRTAKKLRFLVPSALRAPAAGYLVR